LQTYGRDEEWMAEAEALAAAFPDNAPAFVSRCFALLKTGNLRLGLPAWAQVVGRKLETQKGPVGRVRQWRPNQEPGRVLLWSPDGGGDLFMFARYARLAADYGAELELASGGQMHRLMQRCPGVARMIQAYRVNDDDDDAWMCDSDHERYVTVYSLASIFTTREEEIPTEPWLSAEVETVEKWRARLADLPGLKVGLAWKGNPKQDDDARRSFTLEHYRPLFDIRGVSLISIQQDGATGDAPVSDLGRDFHNGDWHETAAVISALDLMITPCTGVAHLAGALGKPVWIALSEPCYWAWGTDRLRSPWYPTARLFRQSRRRDWSNVFTDIAAGLRQLTIDD
jgi:hypothetical protein